MNLFWIIYFLEMLGGINAMWMIIIFISIVSAFILAPAGGFESHKKEWDKYKPFFTKMAVLFFVSSLLFMLTPSKDTAYKMLAAYGVTEAYAAAQESDKVQAIAGKSLKVLEKALDDYLGKDGES